MFAQGFSILTLACIFMLLGCGSRRPETTARAEVNAIPIEKGNVTLVLKNVTAEQWANEILFQCTLLVNNQTGEKLTVLTHCYSAFDFISIKICDEQGLPLTSQIHYFHHSGTFGKKNAYTLDMGETEDTIVFPIRDEKIRGKKLNVHLEGTLPGSSWTGRLESNELAVQATPRPRMP